MSAATASSRSHRSIARSHASLPSVWWVYHASVLAGFTGQHAPSSKPTPQFRSLRRVSPVAIFLLQPWRHRLSTHPQSSEQTRMRRLLVLAVGFAAVVTLSWSVWLLRSTMLPALGEVRGRAESGRELAALHEAMAARVRANLPQGAKEVSADWIEAARQHRRWRSTSAATLRPPAVALVFRTTPVARKENLVN